MAASTPKSLSSRPLDFIYTIWFALHLVIMFAVDLVPLYPTSLQLTPLLTLRQWYITTYQDQLFTRPPAWFTAYAWMEALYHVPLSIWAVGALRRDDPLVPLHLLIWAVQTALTTGTCIADYNSWVGVSAAVRKGLHGLYVPYFVLAVLMGLDMFLRLQARIGGQRRKVE